MKKILVFSKIALCIFIAIFALSFISLNVDGRFLKLSIVEAADPVSGLSIDNPGIRTAIEVQSRHTERLMGMPGVVGHGIGISSYGRPVIKVFVTRAGIPGIPAALEGVPTRVEVTGMVVAYADPTARFPRPVPIGVSTGHPDITAGTIGCRVTDGTNVYALSNNHVYANSNDARLYDNVLQPGPYDGGEDPADAIGRLFDFELIDFSGGNNTIDAAIALSSINDLGTSTPDDGYGIPNSTVLPAIGLGLPVQKYGRTTGLTYGNVSLINATVDVCYETKGPFRCVKLARFIDQIGITPGTFSSGGDSGSLIVTNDENKNPVGLLFAGSNTITFANRIDLVLNNFGVTVDDSTPIHPGNIAPIADFSYTTSGLAVDFSDLSYDSDGNIVAWSWNFGDDNMSTAQSPSHTYSASRTYSVMLTVTDNEGASGSTSKSVTVSDGSSPNITLTATWKQNRIWLIVDLVWSGANSGNVDIFRNDNYIIATTNDGTYTDKIRNSGGGVYTYKVCEEGTTTCSNEMTVSF